MSAEGKKWKTASFSDNATIIEFRYGKNEDDEIRDARNLIMFMPDEETGIDNTDNASENSPKGNLNVKGGFHFLKETPLYKISTGFLFCNYSEW